METAMLTVRGLIAQLQELPDEYADASVEFGEPVRAVRLVKGVQETLVVLQEGTLQTITDRYVTLHP
jgi:hypothetical protein